MSQNYFNISLKSKFRIYVLTSCICRIQQWHNIMDLTCLDFKVSIYLGSQVIRILKID